MQDFPIEMLLCILNIRNYTFMKKTVSFQKLTLMPWNRMPQIQRLRKKIMMFTESRNFGIKILFTIYIFQSEEICFEILKSVNIAKLMNTFFKL